MDRKDINLKPLPVSLGQQGMYIHSDGINQKIYHIDNIMLLEGKIDLATLNQCLNQCINENIVLSHEITRVEGELRFIPLANQKVEFQLIDAKDHDNKSVTDLLNFRRDNPSDSERLPPHTYLLMDLGDGYYYFIHHHHHIYSDLLGASNFFHRILSLYAKAFSAKNSSADDSFIPPSFTDYIKREEQYVQSEEGEKDRKFWIDWVKKVKNISTIPYDFITDHHEKAYTESLYLKPDAEISGGIYTLAQKMKLSPYRIIVSAFLFLLSKIQNETQHTIGFSNHGRHHPDDYKMLGYCINTAPFMTSFDPESTCEAAIRKISDDFKNHTPHYRYPVALLSSHLGNAQFRESGNPFFKISVNVMRTTGLNMNFSGHLDFDSFIVDNPLQYGPLKRHRVSMGQRNYAVDDLVLHVLEDPDEMLLIFNYEGSKFRKKTIERLKEQMNTLLSDLVKNPGKTVKLLNTASNPQELLELSKRSEVGLLQPSEKTIPDFIHGWSQLTPENIAVKMGNQSLSYLELENQINAYAHQFIKLGVNQGETVGIHLDRSLELSSILMAIMRVGAVYLPLDPAYPIERLKYMSQDSSVNIIVTDEDKIKLWNGAGFRTITSAEFVGTSINETVAYPEILVESDDLAYVIYTSGSTGKPKGVEVTHRGAINLVYSQRSLLNLTSDSNVLGFASISFDASIWEMLMSFGSGGTFVTASREDIFPGEPLKRLLKEQKISHVTLPPSVLAHLPEDEYSDLHTIIVAGESCSKRLVKIWGKDRNFFNAYGPTEATVCATMARCTPAMSSVPIGKPIGDTKVYVLDSDNSLVAPGLVGELHISGPLLARGYRNKPELTQASFIHNPWDKAPYDRLYKTGDLVRWNSNDQLEYIGRATTMIKLRGYRIELEEIEARLLEHEEIVEVVVKLIEVPDEEPYLAAYIVSSDKERALDRHELKAFVSKLLPEYMVPVAYVQISALPLMPSGKIDKDALPLPAGHDRQTSTDIVHVSDSYEMIIAEVWKAILNLDHIGKKDNFFDLGGHSLLLLKTQDLIQKTLKVELSTTDLFKYSTVETLADWIKKLDSLADGNETLIAPVSDTNNYDLSTSEKKSRQRSLRSKRLKSRQ